MDHDGDSRHEKNKDKGKGGSDRHQDRDHRDDRGITKTASGAKSMSGTKTRAATKDGNAAIGTTSVTSIRSGPNASYNSQGCGQNKS
jgi:hypothetical protein